jgi:HTH-type transcriptional regulator/antitoxin HigA
MRDINPIRTDDALAWAIKEVSSYFDNEPEPGTEEADRFDVLSDLIEAYERRHFPIEMPEPIALLEAHMQLTGRTQADLGHLLGSRSRASEILKRRRALTVEMIQKLNDEWGIPAEYLIRRYELQAA